MTLTPKKVEANRTNGQLSRGPKTATGKIRSSGNSRVHGLFSKRLRLKNDRERNEYRELHDSLVDDYAPGGIFAELLVDKIAATLWQLGILFGILRKRTDDFHGSSSIAEVQAFAEQTSLLDKPMPRLVDKAKAAPARTSALECRELHLRFVRSHAENQSELGSKSEPAADMDRTEVEARLTPSMDTILRCYATLERTLDKTIRQLREHQKSED